MHLGAMGYLLGAAALASICIVILTTPARRTPAILTACLGALVVNDPVEKFVFAKAGILGHEVLRDSIVGIVMVATSVGLLRLSSLSQRRRVRKVIVAGIPFVVWLEISLHLGGAAPAYAGQELSIVLVAGLLPGLAIAVLPREAERYFKYALLLGSIACAILLLLSGTRDPTNGNRATLIGSDSIWVARSILLAPTIALFGLRNRSRALRGGIILLCVAASLRTAERGPLFSFLLAGIATTVLSSPQSETNGASGERAVPRWRSRTRLIVGAGTVALGAVALLASPVSTALTDLLGRPSSAYATGQLASRSPLWSQATHLYASHPVTGLGLGGFSLLGADAYPHNLLLQLASETGTIGVLAFLVLAVTASKYARRSRWYFALLIQAFFYAMTSGDLAGNTVLFLLLAAAPLAATARSSQNEYVVPRRASTSAARASDRDPLAVRRPLWIDRAVGRQRGFGLNSTVVALTAPKYDLELQYQQVPRALAAEEPSNLGDDEGGLAPEYSGVGSLWHHTDELGRSAETSRSELIEGDTGPDSGSLVRTLIRSSGRIISRTLLGQVVALCGAVGLARLYAPRTFGQFAVFFSVFSILSRVAPASLDLAVPLPESDADSQALLLMAAAATCMVGLILALASAAMHVLHVFALNAWMGMSNVLLWMAAAVVAGSGYQLGQAYAARQRGYDRIARASFTQSLIQTVCQLAAAVVSRSASGLVLGVIAGQVAGALMTKPWHQGWSNPLSNRARFRSLLTRYRRFPVASTPSTLVNSVALQLPTFAIAATLGPSVTGQLNLASRIVGVPSNLIAQGTSAAFLGELSADVRSGRTGISRDFGQMFRGYFGFGLIASGAVALVAPFGIPLIFGSRWQLAGLLAALIALPSGLRAVAVPVSQALDVLERQLDILIMEIVRGLFVFGAAGAQLAFRMGPLAAVGLLYAGHCVGYLGLVGQSYRAVKRHDAVVVSGGRQVPGADTVLVPSPKWRG